MKTHSIIKLTELAPNTFSTKKYTPPAIGLLPYGNKPLLDHLLDKLVEQGYKNVTIALSEVIEKHIKKHQYERRWGIKINTLNIHEDREIDQLLMELSRQGTAKIAIFETQRLANIDTPQYYIDSNEVDQIYGILKNEHTTLNTNDFYSNYHRDNIQLLANINNYQINEFELSNEIFVGNGVSSKTLNKATQLKPLTNSLIIGNNSFVDKSTVISGQASIGKDCFIDKGVILDNTVILPTVYVGQHLNLSNCIVAVNWVFNVHTGGLIEISDNNLLSVT